MPLAFILPRYLGTLTKDDSKSYPLNEKTLASYKKFAAKLGYDESKITVSKLVSGFRKLGFIVTEDKTYHLQGYHAPHKNRKIEIRTTTTIQRPNKKPKTRVSKPKKLTLKD